MYKSTQFIIKTSNLKNKNDIFIKIQNKDELRMVNGKLNVLLYY